MSVERSVINLLIAENTVGSCFRGFAIFSNEATNFGNRKIENST